MGHETSNGIAVYTRPARRFHWLVAFLILLQVPIGLYMSYRGNEMPGVNEKGEPVNGVWDATTGFLYSSHKVIGLTILFVVLARLIYRLTQGAPASDPSLPGAMKGGSHFVHWSLYLLLLMLPVGGYLGTSYGRYLEVFGIPLPAVTPEDKDMSKELFEWHETGAWILIAFVAVHILAAIYHRFIRKDRVVERMLPGKTVA